MKTIILMWNPAISSYKMEDFKKLLKHVDGSCQVAETEAEDDDAKGEDSENDTYINWSVWEYEKAHWNDRFFLVRVGEGNTGIAMSGTFGSDPYEDEDWSGKGRKTFYMDLEMEAIIDIDLAPYISTEQLMNELPGFDWAGGYSGRVLEEDTAEKLEAIWAEYLYKNTDFFDNKQAAKDEYNFGYTNEVLNGYLRRIKGEACEICGYDYKKVWNENCKQHNTYKLYMPDPKTRMQEDDNAWKHYHCVCMNCSSVPDEDLYKKLGEPELYTTTSDKRKK